MRVLIVDDHPIIVSGCRALLEGEPEVEVIEAQDGAAGFAAFFNLKPDVGVIDINLPGYSGLELLRRILEREPEARLVIFSMNDDPTVAARAIEAGAKGYIAKNDDPTLFAGAVKTVAKGGRYLTIGLWSAPGTVPVEPRFINNNNLRIFGSALSQPGHLHAALQVARKYHREYAMADVITHRFSLDASQSALEAVARLETVKAVITPGA